MGCRTCLSRRVRPVAEQQKTVEKATTTVVSCHDVKYRVSTARESARAALAPFHGPKDCELFNTDGPGKSVGDDGDVDSESESSECDDGEGEKRLFAAEALRSDAQAAAEMRYGTSFSIRGKKKPNLLEAADEEDAGSAVLEEATQSPASRLTAPASPTPMAVMGADAYTKTQPSILCSSNELKPAYFTRRDPSMQKGTSQSQGWYIASKLSSTTEASGRAPPRLYRPVMFRAAGPS